jgi:hypothetical protein
LENNPKNPKFGTLFVLKKQEVPLKASGSKKFDKKVQIITKNGQNNVQCKNVSRYNFCANFFLALV